MKISHGHPDLVMAALRKVIYDSQDEHTYRLFAILIEQVYPQNLEVFYVLMDLLEKSKDQSTRSIVVNRLIRTILNTNHSFIFTAFEWLKERITIYKNDPEIYNYYLLFLGYCAENMTYPAFHKAWHPQEEVEKTTTPKTQTLNQADLPQSLQSAITNDLQLSQIIHLIYIDSSQFIEPDNPAEIYDQMLDQNCPECDSVPEKMPALKLYWNSLKRNSNKRPFLVFYASSIHPYNETFLTALSKFGREIRVITEQPIDYIPLKYFTPSQSIKDILEWIRTN
ncbi:MAG: hypothetical protein RIM23_01770 [Coleofasciculus sp. G3-WIS-01]|uniref:NACHT C-terminal alpha/beta 1 domain-containing protein n=1 Tax=Coleofasciculus sp. G3-WIS-01 TaxID=3069528 RepID=UPI0033013A4B